MVCCSLKRDVSWSLLSWEGAYTYLQQQELDKEPLEEFMFVLYSKHRQNPIQIKTVSLIKYEIKKVW